MFAGAKSHSLRPRSCRKFSQQTTFLIVLVLLRDVSGRTEPNLGDRRPGDGSRSEPHIARNDRVPECVHRLVKGCGKLTHLPPSLATIPMPFLRWLRVAAWAGAAMAKGAAAARVRKQRRFITRRVSCPAPPVSSLHTGDAKPNAPPDQSKWEIYFPADDLSVQLHARGGNEPMSLWLLGNFRGNSRQAVSLFRSPDRKLLPADLGTVIGPDRYSLRGAAGGLPGADFRSSLGRVICRHSRARGRRPTDPAGMVQKVRPCHQLRHVVPPSPPALPTGYGKRWLPGTRHGGNEFFRQSP